jgi:hypothetical protein
MASSLPLLTGLCRIASSYHNLNRFSMGLLTCERIDKWIGPEGAA